MSPDMHSLDPSLMSRESAPVGWGVWVDCESELVAGNGFSPQREATLSPQEARRADVGGSWFLHRRSQRSLRSLGEEKRDHPGHVRGSDRFPVFAGEDDPDCPL
jgi:hypothetical protein